MNNEKCNLLLRCNDNLRKNVNKFIEIFVNYYGEEQREFITKRFNDALFIGYLTDDSFNRTLDELEKSESNRLYDKILSETNLEVNKKQLFENYSMRWSSLHPIGKYIAFYNEYILGPEGREKKYYDFYYRALCNLTNEISYEDYMNMVKTNKVPPKFENYSDNKKQLLLSYADISNGYKKYERMKKEAVEFLNTFDPSITIENIEEKVNSLSKLNTIVEKYQNAKNDFETFKKGYQEYYDIQEHNKNLKESLSNKYYKEYLYEVLNYLPEEHKNKLETFLNSGEDDWNLDYNIKKIVGYSINSSSLLECFSSLSNDKLKSDKTSEWEKKSIIENRIEYFRVIGIDLGNNYESYLQMMDIFPKCEKIDELISKKEQLYNKLNREYYNNIIPQKYFIEEAKERGFLEYDANESAEMYMLKCTCVCPNIVMKNGNYELAAKVRINFDLFDLDYIDHCIVHELNHLYELHLVNVDGNQYNMVCGWDILSGSTQQTEEDLNLNRDKRQYELFNEIINEKIAQDISSMMEKNGLSVFSENSGNYKNKTSYEYTNYLVSDFFDKYKKEILASRRDNNIQIIFDAVGKDNFDELNKLFKIHNEHFAGFKIYNLYSDLEAKRDTERTRLFFELVNKRNQLLEKMEKNYGEKMQK